MRSSWHGLRPPCSAAAAGQWSCSLTCALLPALPITRNTCLRTPATQRSPAPQAAHAPCLLSAGTTYGLWSTGCAGGGALCCPLLPVCALAMVMSAIYAQQRKRICSPGAGLHVAHWEPRRCMSRTAARGSTTAATLQHSSALWSAFPTSASGFLGCVPCCHVPPCLGFHVPRSLKAAHAHASVLDVL